MDTSKLDAIIRSGSAELFAALNNPEERAFLEDLTDLIIRLITKNSLNIRQVAVLLELVQAEVKELKLS
jgi:hypothetical protein